MIIATVGMIYGANCKYSEGWSRASETVICEDCEYAIKGRYCRVVEDDGISHDYHKKCFLQEMRSFVRFPAFYMDNTTKIEDEESLQAKIPKLDSKDKVVHGGLECSECGELRMQEIVRRNRTDTGEKFMQVWYRCLNPECGSSEFT